MFTHFSHPPCPALHDFKVGFSIIHQIYRFNYAVLRQALNTSPQWEFIVSFLVKGKTATREKFLNTLSLLQKSLPHCCSQRPCLSGSHQLCYNPSLSDLSKSWSRLGHTWAVRCEFHIPVGRVNTWSIWIFKRHLVILMPHKEAEVSGDLLPHASHRDFSRWIGPSVFCQMCLEKGPLAGSSQIWNSIDEPR